MTENGQIIGIFAQGNDVTDRVLAERLAREKDANFQAVTQIMPNQLWTARPDGSVDWVNERATRVFRPAGSQDSHSEISGWRRFIRMTGQPQARPYLTAIRTGTPYETEFRARRHDGEYRWFLARAIPVRDADERHSNGGSAPIPTSMNASWRKTRMHAGSGPAMAAQPGTCWSSAISQGLITAVNPAITRILGWERG